MISKWQPFWLWLSEYHVHVVSSFYFYYFSIVKDKNAKKKHSDPYILFLVTMAMFFDPWKILNKYVNTVKKAKNHFENFREGLSSDGEQYYSPSEFCQIQQFLSYLQKKLYFEPYVQFLVIAAIFFHQSKIQTFIFCSTP